MQCRAGRREIVMGQTHYHGTAFPMAMSQIIGAQPLKCSHLQEAHDTRVSRWRRGRLTVDATRCRRERHRLSGRSG